MTLAERLRQAAGQAARLARGAARTALDTARADPRISARVAQAEAAFDEARKAMQAQLEQVEADLWAWIKQLQAEARKYERQASRRLTAEDHYRTLGLEKGAPIAEVKRAYRERMRAHHPDKFAHDPEAEAAAHAAAQRINEAYQELTALLTGRESRRSS